MMNLVFKWVASPVGALKLVGHNAGLAAILWERDSPRRVRLGALTEDPDNGPLGTAERQLSEYFQGERKNFDVRSPSPARPFRSGSGRHS
jgi:methylated-DNA-[protein]-cysteine S-methyltransferase